MDEFLAGSSLQDSLILCQVLSPDRYTEYVIYMVKGKDVRRTSLEKIEKEVL